MTAANTEYRTHVSLSSAVLSVVAAVTLAVLSHFEHARSVRPSFIINFYLVTTALFDAVRVRTHWLMKQSNNEVLASIMTASLAVKLVILLLEATEKRSLLLGLYNRFSLESTSGLISRSSFWWLNSLLISGHRSLLSLNDLPAIHEKLDSASLGDHLQSIWDRCKSFLSGDMLK